MNTIAFLVPLIAYLGLFLWDDYPATLLSVIMIFVAFSIWALSYIVEWVERSKVPKSYYQFALSAWLSPLVAIVLYGLLRGEFSWLKAPF